MPIFNTEYKSYYEWKPWANTLLYMPLNWDVLDYSGNENNGTWSWTTEYKTIWDKQYAYINTNSCINLTSSPIWTWNPDDFTFSCWVRINENSYWAQPVYLGSDSTNNRFCLILNYYWVNRNNFQHINDIYVNTIYLWPTTSTPEHKWEWINVIYTYEKATQTSTLYINNSQTWTDNGYPINIASGGNYRIARPLSDSNFANYWLSEIIFENWIWSAQERSDYYNWTKWNYGL